MSAFLHSLFVDRALYIGIVIGYTLRYLWCHIHARWLDKYRPSADGKHHRRPLANRTIVSGTLAAAVVWFSLTSVHNTAQRTDETNAMMNQLAKTTLDCEHTLAESIRADRQLSLSNDALAAIERGLNAQAIKASSDWIALVVTPPQNIFDLHTTDPEYQDWARGVNKEYLDKLNMINQKLEAVSTQRQAIVNERNLHPVPDPNCGKLNK